MLTSVRLQSIAVVTLLLLSGCGLISSVRLGDYADSSAAVAESSLTNLGLIPKLSEEYSDLVPAGKVIRTDPAPGSRVSAGGTVLVFVSSGPAFVYPEQAQISWKNVGGADLDWEFPSANSLFIRENTLVGTFELTMNRDMYWHDPTSLGSGFGEAAITDTFDKVVPLLVIFENEETPANEWQTVSIRVPLSDLDIQKPTTVYMRLFAWIRGSYQEIPLTLTMSW